MHTVLEARPSRHTAIVYQVPSSGTTVGLPPSCDTTLAKPSPSPWCASHEKIVHVDLATPEDPLSHTLAQPPGLAVKGMASAPNPGGCGQCTLASSCDANAGNKLLAIAGAVELSPAGTGMHGRCAGLGNSPVDVAPPKLRDGFFYQD